MRFSEAFKVNRTDEDDWFDTHLRSLFSCWENPSTPTGRRSKRTCHL